MIAPQDAILNNTNSLFFKVSKFFLPCLLHAHCPSKFFLPLLYMFSPESRMHFGWFQCCMFDAYLYFFLLRLLDAWLVPAVLSSSSPFYFLPLEVAFSSKPQPPCQEA
ncbi:hypothetical protein QL285_063062 [Trifolium repens]|nr:hypothetical protein QL285_063062 [Trifolium repens]